MDDKDRYYQQLAYARYKYGNFTRDKARRFREERREDEEYRRERQQMDELATVEKELDELKANYMKACAERGRGHIAARIIEAQEREAEDFMKRASLTCESRARQAANAETRRYLARCAQSKQKKEDILIKRRELFDRDWKETGYVRSRKENQEKELEDELRHLKELEDQLERKKSEARSREKPASAYCESALEREAERAIWPERPVSNWDLLRDDSTISAIPFDTTLPPTDPRKMRFEVGVPDISERRYQDDHRDEVRSERTVPKYGARVLKEIVGPFEDLNSDTFPQKIAQKVYKSLEAIKKSQHQSGDDPTRIYRDAGTNTSTQKVVRTIPMSVVHASTPHSVDTSYRSLPSDPIRPKKLKRAMQILEGQIVDAINETASSSGSSSSDIERLLEKVDKIKVTLENEKSKFFTRSHLSTISETLSQERSDSP